VLDEAALGGHQYSTGTFDKGVHSPMGGCARVGNELKGPKALDDGAELSIFDRILLGLIDEVLRNTRRWSVYSHDLAARRTDVPPGAEQLALAAVEAAFLRLADAYMIESIGGAQRLAAQKRPYGLTAAGVANSIPTKAVVEAMSDDDIAERIRLAVDADIVRRPYLVEQEIRRHGVRRNLDATRIPPPSQ